MHAAFIKVFLQETKLSFWLNTVDFSDSGGRSDTTSG